MVYSFHLHPRSSLGRGVDASMRNGVGSDHAIAAAARAWTCDSDKQYDSGTLSGRGVNGVSSLKSAFAGDEWQEGAGRGHAMEERADWPIPTAMSGEPMAMRQLS